MITAHNDMTEQFDRWPFNTHLARSTAAAYANIVHLHMPYHAIKQKARDSTCKVQSYRHDCAPFQLEFDTSDDLMSLAASRKLQHACNGLP